MCVVLDVSVISVFDAVAFLPCMHRVSSACEEWLSWDKSGIAMYAITDLLKGHQRDGNVN